MSSPSQLKNRKVEDKPSLSPSTGVVSVVTRTLLLLSDLTRVLLFLISIAEGNLLSSIQYTTEGV